ncbi:hypothetical protein RG47T_0634 [Mucilaginibacter polytrichastri]|uniref:Uncharacterized protein n=1 Tax=Mucilaginibacter polytrichastri TaxID=1302689 RepID=A0A1Q5ZTU7_9SPHI|nr:hypothetical protein RG47T_0634 [Mucilaginibacter polytrichastri]
MASYYRVIPSASISELPVIAAAINLEPTTSWFTTKET